MLLDFKDVLYRRRCESVVSTALMLPVQEEEEEEEMYAAMKRVHTREDHMLGWKNAMQTWFQFGQLPLLKKCLTFPI